MINEKAGYHTKKEIFQQPEMWMKTYGTVFQKEQEISGFLKRIYDNGEVDMILTGAGSSAFIGNAVFGVKFRNSTVRVVPTTELVTHPEYFLFSDRPTMLVSFARSGNSPESVAAIEKVDKYCRQSFHIIVTCNEKGDLFQRAASPNTLKILLPPETNDEGLAMTSSFSSLMLTYILIAKIDKLHEERRNVIQLSTWGNFMLRNYEKSIAKLASLNFTRAVFLGSGLLKGIAEESQLKLQELTDGRVICSFNSFLGFRHGPIAVVNEETLLVYLFAEGESTMRYEYDLVRQINIGKKGMAQVAVSHKPVNIDGVAFDLNIHFGIEEENTPPIEYLGIVDVIFAQLLGYYKSLDFGLNPDNPSESGSFSRVVEGVKIY